jgi:hypothetical protein
MQSDKHRRELLGQNFETKDRTQIIIFLQQQKIKGRGG